MGISPNPDSKITFEHYEPKDPNRKKIAQYLHDSGLLTQLNAILHPHGISIGVEKTHQTSAVEMGRGGSAMARALSARQAGTLGDMEVVVGLTLAETPSKTGFAYPSDAATQAERDKLSKVGLARTERLYGDSVATQQERRAAWLVGPDASVPTFGIKDGNIHLNGVRSRGAEEILRARARQMHSGATTERDVDVHGNGELIRAAKCYLNQSRKSWPRSLGGGPTFRVDGRDITTSLRVSELARAGAFIQAEIDRQLLAEERGLSNSKKRTQALTDTEAHFLRLVRDSGTQATVPTHLWSKLSAESLVHYDGIRGRWVLSTKGTASLQRYEATPSSPALPSLTIEPVEYAALLRAKSTGNTLPEVRVGQALASRGLLRRDATLDRYYLTESGMSQVAAFEHELELHLHALTGIERNLLAEAARSPNYKLRLGNIHGPSQPPAISAEIAKLALRNLATYEVSYDHTGSVVRRGWHAVIRPTMLGQAALDHGQVYGI